MVSGSGPTVRRRLASIAMHATSRRQRAPRHVAVHRADRAGRRADRRAGRWLGVAAGAFVAITALVGCAGSAGDRLLVTEATPTADGTGTIWAVEPGEELGDDAVVARGAAQPLGVTSKGHHGTSWTNQWGRAWAGRVLMSWAGSDEARVTVGAPGDEGTTLVSARSRIRTDVISRGLFVSSADGCSLARGAARDDVEEVGTGNCSISDDERWVVSWPAEPTPGAAGVLTIRDLRTGTVRELPDISAVHAVAIGRDARVLAAESVDGGLRGVVLDATSGRVVGRTEVYPDMRLAPAVDGSTAFLALGQEAGGSVLLSISTAAEVTVIDRGLAVVPLTFGRTVHYLRLDDDPRGDTIRRWEPGGEAETLLTASAGPIGAAAIGTDHIIATRQVGSTIEIHRESGSGALEETLRIPIGSERPATADTMLVQGDRVFMVLSAGADASTGEAPDKFLVRLELHGDDSIVALRDLPSISLAALDHDGTALIVTRRELGDGEDELRVLSPRQDTTEVRTTAGATGINLIHDGVIYFSAADSDGRSPEIRSVRAYGSADERVLYRDRVIAGATWPEQGEAQSSFLLSRAALEAAVRTGPT
jgi:hypothetical protein